ncbi:TPA: hypothetical protein ACHU7U_001299 [Streptococcus suis]
MKRLTKGGLALKAIMSLTAYSLTGPTEGGTQTSYTFPAEEEQHVGTWLTWPHQHTYGKPTPRLNKNRLVSYWRMREWIYLRLILSLLRQMMSGLRIRANVCL